MGAFRADFDARVTLTASDDEVTSPRASLDRLHRALSDARDTAASSDVAVERARAVLELARHPRRRASVKSRVANS